MPIGLIIIMVIINLSILGYIAYDYFKKNYTIVDLETWNKIATFYNENANEDGEYQELAGGIGSYFSEYYVDYDNEEEEEDE